MDFWPPQLLRAPGSNPKVPFPTLFSDRGQRGTHSESQYKSYVELQTPGKPSPQSPSRSLKSARVSRSVWTQFRLTTVRNHLSHALVPDPQIDVPRNPTAVRNTAQEITWIQMPSRISVICAPAGSATPEI